MPFSLLLSSSLFFSLLLSSCVFLCLLCHCLAVSGSVWQCVAVSFPSLYISHSLSLSLCVRERYRLGFDREREGHATARHCQTLPDTGSHCQGDTRRQKKTEEDMSLHQSVADSGNQSHPSHWNHHPYLGHTPSCMAPLRNS